MRKTLYRLGIRGDDLDDLEQEVALVVLRKIGGFGYRAEFETWLYAICWRVVRLHQRRRRKSARDAQDVLFGSLAWQADDQSPLGRLIESERLAEFCASYWQLAGPRRDLLALRECGGLSIHELTELLYCKEQTVRARLTAARHHLAANLRRQAVARAERSNPSTSGSGAHALAGAATSIARARSSAEKYALHAWRVGSCLVLRWGGTPTPNELENLRAEFSATLDDPVPIISLFEATSGLPDFEARQAWARLMRDVPRVKHAALLCGDSSLLQRVLTACAWLSGWEQAFFSIAGTEAIPAACRWLCRTSGKAIDSDAILRHVRGLKREAQQHSAQGCVQRYV